MYILISLTLFSIIYIIYSHLEQEDSVPMSYIILILLCTFGWWLAGNFISINDKDKIAYNINIKDYKITKLTNAYILEDKYLKEYEIEYSDSLKNKDINDLKINMVYKYNMYNSKIDSILKIDSK